ncbi:extracellular glycosidase CRH11-like [Ceratitis capitata]|uniref:extracellular glycosidase CRH11-like n=1 Tax=Ceratitis capitata TaxID=7213 RepID=UPI000A11C4E1|nr:extracellular glycosidase CRH11-like [Ceratitis capitata]
MKKIIFLLLSVAFWWVHSLPLAEPQPEPEPQDFQTGALLLVGQMKEIMENGAAAANEQEFEFLGAKISNGMGMGFGDAMKFPGGRRRRRDIGEQELGAGNSLSYEDSDYSLSDYSYASEDSIERKKRHASSSSSSSSSGSSSSSSGSSSSSSDESD